MRSVAALLVAGLLVPGCASNSYTIPSAELTRLANLPPEQRAQHVMVSQEITQTDVSPAESVGADTEIIWIPEIRIGGSYAYGGRRPPNGTVSGGVSTPNPNSSGGVSQGGGGKGGGTNLGSGGSDGKAMAVIIVVAAVVALVAVAAVEGSRFDGWVEMHPMMPVHLIGKDGSQTVMPLAWIDPQAAAWTEKAIVRPYEGPWRELGRRPLMRGGTYGVYGGYGSTTSVTGQQELGPSFTIQGGYFPTNTVGILANLQFAWRDNQFGGTLFDSRYSIELQALPVRFSPLHLGGYANIGLAYRWEDVPGATLEGGNGNNGSGAFGAGGMAQLELHSRIALTARAGVLREHGDLETDLTFGLSVY